ncbi:DUF5686 family protein [Siphonobacter sp. SORGH_AS_0500]|uniref:DUF5686 and carboxypeptidase-like regulatory domain-containing protein n=1 Tax=Siphonobacter sp. SORGH_AS_0500 TaxID=1864824 RepID=UPI0028560F6F|nr:DUF5686 family protein [Siphonobacter sp. SORGH_AS_0500]MDR6194975.1 hypothetical protein [Siphonobacter sp. SORGH_AS_0500]
MNKWLLAVLLSLGIGITHAQHIIKGKITDAVTGDPIPFAAVGLKGGGAGANTDFDGNYTFNARQLSDSIFVSYIGYQRAVKAVQPHLSEQIIDFQLQAGSSQLREVRIFAKGENPAFRIIRKTVAAKSAHDWGRLKAYEYESYVKNEFDVNKISEQFKKGVIGRKITGPLDKLQRIAGEDGKPIIPVFLSESISDLYHRRNPELTKERIRKTKITGVGITDGSTFSQFIGSAFQQYNFYENWLLILRKEFISPIADGWKGSYDYFLGDTIQIDSAPCFEIEVTPKRAQDLAFTGKIWIDTASYALRQVDLQISGDANINYVESIKIQQQLAPITDSVSHEKAWLPQQTRVLIDVKEFTKNSVGFLAKFFVSNRNFKINQAREVTFYNPAIELADHYRDSKDTYWQEARPDSLTEDEKTAYSLIDSVKNIPIVRSYTQVLTIIANGYQRVYPGIEVGPFLSAGAYNTIEGLRLRAGFRTNAEFSKVWVMDGYLAYGFKDGVMKYGANAKYILSRKPWAEIGARTSYDLEQIGLTSEAVGNNSLFAAYSRFGRYRRGYYQREHMAYIRGEIIKGLTPMIGIRQRSFEPLYNFAYITENEPSGQSRTYHNTELITELRIAKNELFIYNDNDRISLGTAQSPIYTLRYSLGLQNTLGGDFNYHRFTLSMADNFRLGILGRSYYTLSAGYTPSTLPYPLLFPHLGNQSLFYVGNAFNMMNYYEFLSDRYASLKYEHNFEGLLFNRIPAIKKLKWRTLLNVNVLYGGARQSNQDIIPDYDLQGNAIPGFGSLNPSKPYVEIGYGIDNILKFFRIEALHRLTYISQPRTIDGIPINRFAVKASAYFTL